MNIKRLKMLVEGQTEIEASEWKYFIHIYVSDEIIQYPRTF